MKLLWLVSALVFLLVAPTAQAAPWKRVTTADLTNIDQVGLARTADGVLHLAWSRIVKANPQNVTEDLHHTAIAPNGALGQTSTIDSGWRGFTDAALVVDPGGLRVFVGGQRSVDPNETNDELSAFLSADGGASWTPPSGNIVPDGGQAYAYPVAAATLPSGETLQTWAGTLGTWVHAGLTPANPIFDYQKPHGPYGYNPNLAVDSAGNAMLAWYSSGAAGRGVRADGVGALGAPAGGSGTMPGTGGMTSGMVGLTPLVARPGGGFYVAYPVGRAIRLWRIGDGSARAIARTRQRSPAVTLAATADGRLWLSWVARTLRGPRVLATRSNQNATIFGAVVSGGRPRGSAQANTLNSSAAGGLLDVLPNFNIGATPDTAIYHRRLLPGLTLRASPQRLRLGVAQDVRLTVTDAGDPVSGARVRVGGISGSTGANGAVTLRLPGRSATASATKSRYVGARLRLRAVRVVP